MKNLVCFAAALALVFSCTQKPEPSAQESEAQTETADSTIYGICGEGTMMHNLELITSTADTLHVFINDEDSDAMTLVVGGLMCGDRMAVTAQKNADGALTAQHVINLTSLLGHWSSLDKNFEITDDGVVRSYLKVESNTWTAWRILNGQLLLNRDTFNIAALGADSLELENGNGIFFYRRVRNGSDGHHEVRDSVPL